MTRNRTWTEDLFQTTFLKLHRGRHGWIPGSEVMPWVMAIARNAFLDEVSHNKRAPVRLTATGDEFELVNLAAIGGEHGQETTEGGHQIAEALESAVAALPENHREALFLTKQSGLTHAQAAQVLGTTETAVKLRVFRAHEALRAALRKYREPEQ
jgi:RNA polymerase sigma-70 factor (ECF subfamily)